MITINFETLEDRLEAYRAEQKPLRIVVKSATQPVQPPKPTPELTDQDREYITNKSISQRKEQTTPLIHQLENEKSALLVERNKLSSQIWKMVENGASQTELRAHYNKIEEYRPGLIAIYDKIKHVKQHGTLPSAPTTVPDMEDIYQLKDMKKKLVDKRCKLKAKLKESAKPSRPEKILEWQQELAQADIEYNDVEQRLKQLEGKA